MSRLRDERGIAMPVALAVLLLCLVLTAAVATGADRLTRTAGEDQWGKSAFAAANAGLDTAVARLRALGPAVTAAQCLTDRGVLPGTGGAAAGECPAYEQTLGTGARFKFTVTPATTAAGSCYAVPGTVVPAGALRRCITAIGTVNGVSRRVQAQVIAKPAGAGHWIGILGLDGVTLRNSPRLGACLEGPAVIGSNAFLDVGAGTSGTELNWGCTDRSWTLALPAGKTPTIQKDTKPQPTSSIPRQATTTPFTIDPAPRRWEEVEKTNANAQLATDFGSRWSPLTRTIDLGNDTKIVLRKGGDYHLCQLAFGNQGSIDFPTNEKTRIFIDSPTRQGSPCGTGTGQLLTQNDARFNWPASVLDTDEQALSARAKNVEVYIHGNGTTVTTYGNQVRFAALIHAPSSPVVFDNSSNVFGAVAAKAVTLINGTRFRRPANLDQLGGSGSAWATTGWGQCSSAPPAPADPESGC